MRSNRQTTRLMGENPVKRNERTILPARMLALFLLFGLCFTISYSLLKLLFRLTGQPPEPISYVIFGFIAILLFYGGVFFYFLIQHSRNKDRQNHFPGGMLDEALDAMDRIAHGDFNISVASNGEHDPLHEVAESINKMAKELGSMEKLRQDFISNVSHEIQSPLTSISGYATLLQKEGISPEQGAKYARIIETESKRLSALSTNLLKLSALEAEDSSLERKLFRLDKQLESILLMLEPQWAGRDISPQVDLDKITFSGNADLLNEVWINLLNNAIKFTPEGGWVRVSLHGDHSQVVCSIADNGMGIPQEDQPHIFERFYRVDKSRDRSLGGNGLGLSLVRKIVELHGGRVTVESELGNGSTFIITMPMVSSPEEAPDMQKTGVAA